MSCIYCFDGKTVKWSYDDVNYCLHIQREETGGFGPRDYSHESIMACFDPKCKYGDEIEERTAEEFWRNMVWKYCSDEEIFDAFSADMLFDIRVVKVDDNDYTIYTQSLNKEWEAIYRGLDKDEVLIYVKDMLSIGDCMILMDHGNHAVWLALYIHEHSGVSMSIGTFGDEWDTSCVGWIVTPMCQNHNSADAMKATRVMREEVKEYDRWLQGEVYRYTLYEQDGWVLNDAECSASPNWEEIDSCGGFIGDDAMRNGMADNIGNGFRKAVETGNIEFGIAKKTVVVKWEF